MILLDVEQGSTDWHRARLGIPTASNFGRIVTPAGKRSSQADAYMMELLAAWAIGEPQDETPNTYWIDRGKELEAEARAFYELMVEDAVIRTVGFVYRDESRMVGCSPDWLVGMAGRQGGAELKCPKASTHVSYLLGGTVAATYVPQVQGAMWVTGADFWHFVSYYPGMPPLMVEVERDPEFQAALDAHIPPFIETMLERRAALSELGVTPETIRIEDVDLSDLAMEAGDGAE